ncbi:MAG: GNAT family N-acetyltransferase [Dehalococcoidia bacterium]
MTADRAVAQRLLAVLPDIPRWMETRAVLMCDDCELDVVSEEPPVFVVGDPLMQMVSVVGEPPSELIRKAVARIGECNVLAQEDNRRHVEAALSGWLSTTARLLLQADESAMQAVPPGDVRILTGTILDGIPGVPGDLRDELQRLLLRWPAVVAYTEEGEAAAFCAAGSPTEGLWDIGIDTLEPYRRQGYAAQAVRFLVDLMWERRKRPVWGALETNAASLALAAKLGFRPVDTMVVFEQPD